MINGWLLGWRILMRACFTTSAYGLARGPAVDPAAGRRQCHRDAGGGPGGFAARRRRRQALGQDAAHLSGRASAMRPSLRFLGACGDRLGRAPRAPALGVLPGAEIFQVERGEAKAPPLVPTEFPPIEPIPPAGSGRRLGRSCTAPPCAIAGRSGRSSFRSMSPWPSSRRRLRRRDRAPLRNVLPLPAPRFLSADPTARRVATVAHRRRRRCRRRARASSLPGKARRSRFARTPRPLQLTAWALLRRSRRTPGSRSLATGGTLGGKPGRRAPDLQFHAGDRGDLAHQSASAGAAARSRRACASSRSAASRCGSPPSGARRLGKYGGGRNAFALFLEGGVYDRPMPWHSASTPISRAAWSAFNTATCSSTAALTLTRPVYKHFSAGFGVWGGAQPGLYRVDAGPRLSMRVRNNVRVHLD